jgi:monofunctional biosynthetic peptidoglycan transglycosylase
MHAAPRRKEKPGWFRRALKWTLFLVVAFYVVCVLCFLGLRHADPPFTAVQAQRRAEAAFDGSPYEHRQTFVPLDHIPLHLQRAVVAAEDGRFYEHAGIDWMELEKVVDERRTRLRGGSTITQQLVKNLFLTTHRSLVRKAVEFTLAPIAEGILSKPRILELYLNVIEWGPGVYGVEAAARHHYGISASQVNEEQAVRLAACIPSPRRWKPQQMDTYSAEIRQRMRARGW